MAFGLALLFAAMSAGADAFRKTYDIPAGLAEKTLKVFSAQSGLEVVFASRTVGQTRTNPVTGNLSAREAINQLLDGTGLVVTQDPKTGAMRVLSDPNVGRAAPAAIAARPVPATPRERPIEEEVIELSPFVITGTSDVGYVATSALAGGRTDTSLKLTPSAISAMTPELLEDLAVGDIRDALEWTLNAEPGRLDLNENAQGGQEYNFRGTTSAGNYPTRNYFLYYGVGDSYNTERFEFARGPNAVLFGDAQLGGVATTFTKVPRLKRTFGNASLRYTWPSEGTGSVRATLDYNVPLADKAAIRVNVLGEDGRSWRDYSDRTHHAIALAGLYQFTADTQVRVEGESGRKRFNVFSPNFSDGISFWNGVYSYEGANVLSAAAATAAGVTRIGAVRNVWIPAVPEAGYSNWLGSYRTAGPGLALLPYPRASVANSVVLPSRKFTVAPTDVKADQHYKSLTAFLDHRFSEALHGQAAYYYYTLDNQARSHVTLGSVNLDLNQRLPNGATNPKFGVPFSEVTPRRLNPYNEISEVRGLLTYRKRLPNFFDLNQRLTAIAGVRRETFKNTTKDLRQVAGPNQNPNFNAADMTVFYRYYWDEPLKYNLSDMPNDPSRTFDYVSGPLSNQRKKLDYAQISSLSTFLDDRVSLLLGLRYDKVNQRQQTAVTNANVNNGISQLGAGGVVGEWEHTSAKATSPSIGASCSSHRGWACLPTIPETSTFLPRARPMSTAGRLKAPGAKVSTAASRSACAMARSIRRSAIIVASKATASSI